MVSVKLIRNGYIARVSDDYKTIGSMGGYVAILQ